MTMEIAIKVLEKELEMYRQAFSGWKESSIKEYSEKWKRINKEENEIREAIEYLKSKQ